MTEDRETDGQTKDRQTECVCARACSLHMCI